MSTSEVTHYLVIDVEATCDNAGRVPRHEMEIIEFGAVLVGAPALLGESEFQTFIRPVRRPELSEFCTRLTGIRQQDVEPAPGFPEAVGSFQAWLGERARGTIFCSWGDYDRKQIEQDCRFHRLAYPMPERHLNLKVLFSRTRGLPRRLGLSDALREAGLVAVGRHHRGIDDARNIARLLPFALGVRPGDPGP